jgi:SAM-dependent methyltransferase
MTNPTAADPIRYYHKAAPAFALRYNSVTFEEVHGALAPYLPAAPSEVADIGAGSGRDARALAQLGHRVTAVEPAAAFRIGAGRLNADAAIRWVDDRLPNLSTIKREGRHYAFVLCSAVLMVLRPEQLRPSFKAMASILAKAGRLAVTVRDPADGEPPGLFHRHSSAEIIEAAQFAGLLLLDEQALPDALGREPLHWRSLVFERAALATF